MSHRATPVLFVVACAGFYAMTLNWFDFSAGSVLLIHKFHLGVSNLAIIVSMFLTGYGVFHIPAGVWVRRYGIRRVVVTGLVVESLAAGVVGLAPDVMAIWMLRFLAGSGAALVAGAELTLVTRLFRTHHLARAQSVASSAVYGLGALTGLGLWRPLVRDWGATEAFALAGLVGLAVAALHWATLPSEPPQSAPSDTWAALRRTLRHKNLWWSGLGSMGGYGVYFTLSQLAPSTLAGTFHVHGPTSYYGEAMLATGILGALVGGYWSDVRHTRRGVILGPSLAMAGWLLLWPHLGRSFVLAGFMVSGFLAMLPRPAYTATPGDDRHHIPPSDVATAEGVVFTLLSIGGAVLPVLFGATMISLGAAMAWGALGVATLICGLGALPMRDVFVLGTGDRSPRVAVIATDAPSKSDSLPHT